MTKNIENKLESIYKTSNANPTSICIYNIEQIYFVFIFFFLTLKTIFFNYHLNNTQIHKLHIFVTPMVSCYHNL